MLPLGYRLPAVLCLLSVSACVPRQAGFDSVRSLVRERGEMDVRWRYVEDDASVDQQVAELLGQPIGPEEVVRVALLNNGDLQAAFEELGIARAQLLGASLPPNPEVHGHVGFASGEDRPELGFSATENVSHLIFLSMRRGVAEAELDAVKARAAGETLELAYRVRNAFYDYQAAEQLLEVARTVLEAGAAAYDIAQRLHDAGNLTDLDFANERAFYEETRVLVANAEVTVLARREELNTLMGLSGGDTSWRLSGRLAEPADADPELANLEQRAIERSLDLLELEQRYTASARRANLSRAEALVPSLRAGVQAEREEGAWEIGPVVSLEIPLFDQGQGAVGVAQAQMRQITRQYTARAVRIRAAVRAARNQLVTASRRTRHYRDVLLPLRQEIVDETQRQYNAMQVGVFQLLDVKRMQIRTGQEYVVALRDYWRARATLDQILAGRLVSVPDPDQLIAAPNQMTTNQGGH
jgi:outer membrane protein TolC